MSGEMFCHTELGVAGVMWECCQGPRQNTAPEARRRGHEDAVFPEPGQAGFFPSQSQTWKSGGYMCLVGCPSETFLSPAEDLLVEQ